MVIDEQSGDGGHGDVDGRQPAELLVQRAVAVGNRRETVTQLIPAENQRTDSPANRYLITPDLLNELEKKLKGTDRAIVGFFHSHPDVPAQPSTYDQDHAWPWYSYVIVSVNKGEAGEIHNWKLKDDRSAFDAEKMELL